MAKILRWLCFTLFIVMPSVFANYQLINTDMQLGTIEVNSISGLENHVSVIQNRAGNSPMFSPIKMPGLGRVGSVTLQEVTFNSPSAYWQLLNQVSLNTVTRTTFIIKDIDGQITYQLNNAFPTRLSHVHSTDSSDRVVIDTMTIAFETLVVSAGD